MVHFVLLLAQNQENIITGGTIGAIAVATFTVFKYLVEKFGFNGEYLLKLLQFRKDTYIKNYKDSRTLTSKQNSLLPTNGVFLDFKKITNYHLKDIYINSKKQIVQLLFILQLYYTIQTHEEDIYVLLEEINNKVKKDDVISKKEIIDLILSCTLHTQTNVYKKLYEKGISVSISDTFSFWYKEHYGWYLQSIEILLESDESLYNEIDSYLTITRIFLTAVVNSAKNYINTYNGEISSQIDCDYTDQIDWAIFKNEYEIVKHKYETVKMQNDLVKT